MRRFAENPEILNFRVTTFPVATRSGGNNIVHMKRSLVAILGGAALLAPGYGDITETVAHWSYDAPTLTIAAGSITGVLDSTGDHNATPGSGIGSATVANGGPTFTSNPIPTSNSIPGRFGEALTLTGFNNFAGGGGQFLMFPDIKEIMAANGAPNYTVSMWVNTTNTSFNVFAGLSEWGNAATTPGRFAYGFGPSGPTQMRGQTRFDARHQRHRHLRAQRYDRAAQ